MPPLRISPFRFSLLPKTCRTYSFIPHRQTAHIPRRHFNTTDHSPTTKSDISDDIVASALVYSTHGEPQKVLSYNTHLLPSTPPDNNILLRALAAPINPADINMIQGTYGTIPRLRHNPFGPFGPTLPHPCVVAGNEGVFEVQSTGLSVPESVLKVGDWVIPREAGFGTWRTHALASPDAVWKIPDHLRQDKRLSPLHAAFVAVGPLTALRMLSGFGNRLDPTAEAGEVRGLKEGDWVVQTGANSVVGQMVIQVAKQLGIKTANVIRHHEGKHEMMRQSLMTLGADIVATTEDLPGLRETMKGVTQGLGVPLMLDCVGGRIAATTTKVLGEGAEIVVYGNMSRSPNQVGAGQLIFRDLRYRGFWVSRWGNMFPTQKARDLERLLGWMVEGKVLLPARQRLVKWRPEQQEYTVEVIQGTLGEGATKAVLVFEEGVVPRRRG